MLDRGAALAQHLVDVHDHFRAELSELQGIVEQVRVAGVAGVGAARATLNGMTLRQNSWTLGAYCLRFCTSLTGHHELESGSIFPHLRASDPSLGPVLDKLDADHIVVHDLIEAIDAALCGLVRADDPTEVADVQEAVTALSGLLLEHLSYEEEQLKPALARHGFFAGQV
jgi:hypothetical protein